MRNINPEYCLSNNVFCNVDIDCCSTRCLRPKGKLRLTCLARPEAPPDKNFFESFKSTIKDGRCQPDGQMCMINKDCCSKNCVNIIFPMSVKLYCAPVEVDEKQSNFSSRN
ncbi:hypothetical protein KQX54_017636 [Cotesia glomerata]|uniref:WAP domain-containing protein n=1 Tax=Cotesia glomerata TaxID=32391 RepID=A0AAV7I7N2_COTGL|nr:hypothetical protein KQX54_017636 [Cotesia glomerata]